MGLILHSFPVHTKDLHVSGKQKRNVVQEGKNGGQCSGSAIKDCNLNPVNECKWGQWETCSTTCGPGIQTRLIDQEASHCGKNCFGSDTKSCNLKKCPIVQPSIDKQVNCKWGKWGACSGLCGLGQRTREIEIPAKFGGNECSGSKNGTCKLKECPAVDCVWGSWGPCNSICIQTRYAEIQVQNGGRPCFGERIRKCNLKPCLENPPVDCKWSPWSNCDADCGLGRVFQRAVLEFGQLCNDWQTFQHALHNSQICSCLFAPTDQHTAQ